MALQRRQDCKVDKSQNSVFFGSNNFEVNGGEYLYSHRDVSTIQSYRYYQFNILIININGSLYYTGSLGIRLEIAYQCLLLLSMLLLVIDAVYFAPWSHLLLASSSSLGTQLFATWSLYTSTYDFLRVTWG
ncbi:hypothetical protein BKA70DRAFT_1476018 [Coprinopsis sp. MPI-PUGE-AT-0042]|nr:hypothetical protein BKA70DRAFT_1476018 [Coprinopsis sp. MPI-PUGE-AT-0042]